MMRGKAADVSGNNASGSGEAGDRSWLFFAALAMCFIFLIVSCQTDTLGWYPTGEAIIASHFEYFGSSGKVCVATIEITNTGRSSISQCTVSISATTEARVYLQTSMKEIVIPPGKRAYFDIEIAFVSEDESLKESGLVIEDYFFL